jgi:hypothetical protein
MIRGFASSAGDAMKKCSAIQRKKRKIGLANY